MICAKTPEALAWLQKQFSQRKVKKTYVAIIKGTLSPEHAVIEMPIERNPKKPQTFRVGSNGKVAVTEYEQTKVGEYGTLVVLKPQTGRTHQLRVHLAALKHPIVGDTLYDGVTADRLMLHAHQLELTLPNRTRQTFTAKIPSRFNDYVQHG
jgi:23S rRNA pseudouridine1911/1915/1917 synthase